MKTRVWSIFCIAWVAAGALAATVSNPNESSLRAAVNEGGVVTLAFDGTVHLTNTIVLGKDVTLDAREHDVTISGDNRVRLFRVAAGVQAKFLHLVLADGAHAPAWISPDLPGESAYGGGIYIEQGNVELIDCVLRGNLARGATGGHGTNTPPGEAYGGAIYNHSGRLNISQSIFAQCAAIGGSALGTGYSTGGASAFGGAIYNHSGDVTLSGVQFLTNTATQGTDAGISYFPPQGGALGGAIYNRGGSVRVSRSALIGNRAAKGGGISGPGDLFCSETLFSANAATIAGAIWGQSDIRLQACTFQNNSSSGAAGAIGNTNKLAVWNCTFLNNQALGANARLLNFSYWPGEPAFGGAVVNEGILHITNSTFSANVAKGGNGFVEGKPGDARGGGIYQNRGSAILVNVTFSDNAAVPGDESPGGTATGTGGGIYVTNSTLWLVNSILNRSNSGSNCFGAVIDGGHNLSSDMSCAFTNAGSLNNTDPKLAALADHGGPTLTMALLEGSPALDAGDDLMAPVSDQRGVKRPQAVHCDMGAFEAGAYPVQVLTNGMLRLRFRVLGDHNFCTLQVSTNLVHWEDLTMAAVRNDGVARFDVPKQGTAQFFRTKVPSL